MLGHTGNSFAIALEVNASVINSITGPRQTKPGSDLLEKVKAKFPRVNMNYVVAGEGEPLKPYKGQEEPETGALAVNGIYQKAGRKSTQSVSIGLPECLQRLQLMEQRLHDKDKLLQAKEEVIELLKKQQTN